MIFFNEADVLEHTRSGTMSKSWRIMSYELTNSRYERRCSRLHSKPNTIQNECQTFKHIWLPRIYTGQRSPSGFKMIPLNMSAVIH